MPFRIVQSKQNPRLKQLRRALAQPLRDEVERGRTLAGIEGPNLLEEAVRARLHVECVFVAGGSEHLLESISLPRETEILVLDRKLLNEALTTEAPQPVAALVEPKQWTWDDLLNRPDRHPPLLLILAGLQDPGNLGTILRSAEAFAASGAISLPGTVSAWNPKAVRASAGSVLRLPMLRSSEEDCFRHLKDAGVSIWTTKVNDATPAHEAAMSGPIALVIGNEGNGVPEDLARRAGGSLTIPCPGPVESLNAAVATSILLYEVARQRSVSWKAGSAGRGQ